MGKSQSIATLEKQNSDFSGYIATATANLDKRATPEENKFLQSITDYYKKWDQQPICQGKNVDYRQSAEFSLTSIDNAIQSVANAFFGGMPLPPGAKLLQSTDAIAKLGGKLAGFQSFALAAASTFVSQVLGAFSTSISAEYHSSMSSRSIAPGLTLHAWYYGDVFQKKDYFNNEYIIENVIVFRLIYSMAQGAMEQDINYMDEHTQILVELEEKIVAMQSKATSMVEDSDCSVAKADEYQERVDRLRAKLEGYRTEVDSLVKKYKVA